MHPILEERHPRPEALTRLVLTPSFHEALIEKRTQKHVAQRDDTQEDHKQDEGD
jgi:hypothetical protein